MKLLSYDTETTGLRPHNGDKMFAWSTCDTDGNTTVNRLDSDSINNINTLRALVQDWIDGKLKLAMHNAKFDIIMTEHMVGKKFAEAVAFDCTYLMSCVVRNDLPSHELKEIAYVFGNIPRDDEYAIQRFVRKNQTDYSGVPEAEMREYQKRDAIRTMLLVRFFSEVLEKNPKWKEIYESERQTSIITMRMEERGVMIRRSACERLIEELLKAIDEVLEQAAELAGKEVILSGDRLLDLLFHHFHIPITKHTTKLSSPAVDKDTMLKLREEHGDQFPIIDLVLKYRSWSHGVSILRSYLAHADTDGVIHSSLNSCAAVTARQSAQKPNLLSVSKSQALKQPYPVPSRRIFCPRPGYVNFHVDYSGEELRILIHYCMAYVGRDKPFMKMLAEKGDLHYPACMIFYPEFDTLDPKLKKPVRDAVKNANFAGAYGAGDIKICTTANLPLAVGLPRVLQWREAFPNLSKLNKVVGQRAACTGYVETCFGRRLYLRKAHAAVNTLVQGTGAEILKRGENNADAFLKRATGGEMQLLLPIHDELIIECPRERLEDARGIMPELARQLTNFPQLSVPLEVEIKVATYSWEKAVPYIGWECNGD